MGRLLPSRGFRAGAVITVPAPVPTPTLPGRPALSAAGRTFTMATPSPFSGAVTRAWLLNGSIISGAGVSRTFAPDEYGIVTAALNESGVTSLSLPFSLAPGWSAVSLANAIVSQDAAPGTVVGAILGTLPGAVLTLENDDGGAFAIASGNLVTGLTALAAGSRTITLRQTLGIFTLDVDLAITVTAVAAAPNLLSVSPANGAAGVSGLTALVLTYDKPISQGSYLWGEIYVAGASTPIESWYSTDPDQSGSGPGQWSISGNVLTFRFKGILPTGVEVYAFAGETSVVGATGVPGPGLGQVGITFTTAAAAVPTITGSTTVSVPENSTTVATYSASEAVTWSLTGPDAAVFTISSGGALSFVSARDFETPADAGLDNVYNVTVRATTAAGGVGTRAVAVTVTDVGEGVGTLKSQIEALASTAQSGRRSGRPALKVPGVDPLPTGVSMTSSVVTIFGSGVVFTDWFLDRRFITITGTDAVVTDNVVSEAAGPGAGLYPFFITRTAHRARVEYNTYDGFNGYGGAGTIINHELSGFTEAAIAAQDVVIKRNRIIRPNADIFKRSGNGSLFEGNYFGPVCNMPPGTVAYSPTRTYALGEYVIVGPAIIAQSLQAGNLGHAPTTGTTTSNAWWQNYNPHADATTQQMSSGAGSVFKDSLMDWSIASYQGVGATQYIREVRNTASGAVMGRALFMALVLKGPYKGSYPLAVGGVRSYTSSRAYAAGEIMAWTNGRTYIALAAAAAGQTPGTNPSLWSETLDVNIEGPFEFRHVWVGAGSGGLYYAPLREGWPIIWDNVRDEVTNALIPAPDYARIEDTAQPAFGAAAPSWTPPPTFSGSVFDVTPTAYAATRKNDADVTVCSIRAGAFVIAHIAQDGTTFADASKGVSIVSQGGGTWRVTLLRADGTTPLVAAISIWNGAATVVANPGTAPGDTTAPTLVSSIPADNATGVATTVLPTLTFSEAIAFGTTGAVTLRQNIGGTWSTAEVFSIATEQGTGAGQVSISGAVLTLRPTSALVEGREYAIRVDAGAIRDLAPSPNAFAGIATDTALSFTISAAAAPATALMADDKGVSAFTLDPALQLSTDGGATWEWLHNLPQYTLTHAAGEKVTVSGFPSAAAAQAARWCRRNRTDFDNRRPTLQLYTRSTAGTDPVCPALHGRFALSQSRLGEFITTTV